MKYGTNRMVFREYGTESEVFTLAQDESATFSAVWKVPTTQIDGDGVEGDIKIPINPGRIIPVAVVFDTDDTDSGNDQDSNGDDTLPYRQDQFNLLHLNLLNMITQKGTFLK